MPTVVASGFTSLSSCSCSLTGLRSETPVTLPPGASSEATSSAPFGSVTAMNTTGLSFTAEAVPCAAGVAIAATRSTSPSLAKVEAMEVTVACSPWAFCSSNVTSRPASSNASLKPSAAPSSAGWETSWLMPTV